MMDKVTLISLKYGLDINIKKTKLLIVSKESMNGANIYHNGSPIERVTQYTYLGTMINENWNNSQEIRCRIEKARAAFIKMNTLFKSHNLSMDIKLRLCYVFSILLYGAEAWTLKEGISRNWKPVNSGRTEEC